MKMEKDSSVIEIHLFFFCFALSNANLNCLINKFQYFYILNFIFVLTS